MPSEKEIKMSQSAIEELLKWAKELRTCNSSLGTATDNLMRSFNGVREDMGPFADQIEQMMLHIKRTNEAAKEPLDFLPKKLEQTAQAIGTKIGKKISVGSVPPKYQSMIDQLDQQGADEGAGHGQPTVTLRPGKHL